MRLAADKLNIPTTEPVRIGHQILIVCGGEDVPVARMGTRLRIAMNALKVAAIRQLDPEEKDRGNLAEFEWLEETEVVPIQEIDGNERLVVVTFTSRNASGANSVVINLHDVTVERALEERLRFDAMHDPLTSGTLIPRTSE